MLKNSSKFINTININKEKKISILSWFICILAAIFYFYEYVLRILPSIMKVDLMAFYGISSTVFGMISALYYTVYSPMQLFVGVFMDRYGPRKLLTLACLLCTLGAFLFGGAKILYWVSIGRFLVGFGSAFAFVGVIKLATIWLPPNRLALVTGCTSALGTLGGIFGNTVLGSVISNMGWQFTVFISGVFGFALTAILWIFIRDKNPNQTFVTEVNSFTNVMNDLRIIIKNSQIWINGLVSGLIYLPTTVFAELWGKSYLESVYNISHQESGYAISILFIGFAIGAPISGFISDYFKNRKLPIVIGGFGAAILVSILIGVKDLEYVHLLYILFLMGMFYSTHVVSFVLGREICPPNAAGTSIAITNMFVMLIPLIFQPLIGKILDFMLVNSNNYINSSYDYRVALSVIPVGMILGVFLSLLLKETNGNIGINNNK